MTRRLLDLFAGAGGCSVGYARAGFDVTGVDCEPHDDYPFRLVVADAMKIAADVEFLGLFDVVAGSPPCPRYSTITPEAARESHPDLIGPLRDSLRAWGGLYVIENVEGARKVMDHPVKLCGSAFGLRVRRHRLFESNAFLTGVECYHHQQPATIGVYGDHPEERQFMRPNGTSRGRKARTVMEAADALGIDWMTSWDDLTDAIPPSFTEHLGLQLLEHLERSAA